MKLITPNYRVLFFIIGYYHVVRAMNYTRIVLEQVFITV